MVGARIKARLETIASRNDIVPIAAIRGPGAMIAFDIVKGRGSHEPDADAARRATAAALEEGLILLSCGIHGNAIRILVPLTAPDALLDEGMERLERALVAARV